MTQEDIKLILGWFAHIEQIATDRKTANGAITEDWAALDEIRCKSHDCQEYIKAFCLEPSLPSNLDEAAESIASDIAPTWPDIDWDCCFEKIKESIKAGVELVISELFKKLNITPLKVIGEDEYNHPVYDFEVAHYYETFSLFGQKYKCDQTASGQAGEERMARQGQTVIHKNVWHWGRGDIIAIANGRGLSTISVENGIPNVAYLSGISVCESSRRMGLGNQLLDLSKQHAWEMGAKELRLWADPGKWVFDWYKRHGFQVMCSDGCSEDGLVCLILNLE